MRPVTSIDETAQSTNLTPDAKARAQQRLNDLRQRYALQSPEDFLNGLCDRAINYSRYADIQRIRIWNRNNSYYKGNHTGHFDMSDGAPLWIIDDPTSVEGLYRINLYNVYVRATEALWSKSNTVIEWRPRNDNPDTRGATRVASAIDNAWIDNNWGATERLLEGKHAQICGNYLRRFAWHHKSDQIAFRPKVEQIQVSAEDEGYLCNNEECGMAGPVAANNPQGTLSATGMNTGATMQPLGPDGSCPQCGSQDVYRFGLPPMTASVVTGQEQYDPGDVIGEVIDPMEGTMHLHSQTFPLSPYFVRTRMFDARTLEAHFPWAEVSRSVTTDLRMIYQRMAQLDPGSNYSFLADGSLHDMGQLEEFWFEPGWYVHYVTPDTISGDIWIDPNTAFIEKFPEGIYLQRISGKIVDGPWPANKNMELVHGRFDVVMQSIWGRGQDDALTSNERYEEEGTLAFEIGMHHAAAMTVINQSKIDQNTMSGHPRDMGRMLNPASDDNPGSFIFQGSSMAGSGLQAMAGLMDRDERTMEKQFASYASNRGDSSERAPTATQTAIERDQGNAMQASPLFIKEEVDARSSYLRIKLYQANWTGTRMLFAKGEYDDLECQYFSRADIQGDFIAVAKRGSSIPKGESEKRASILEAGTWGQLPGGIFNEQVVKPKLRRLVLDELGIDYDTDDIAPDYRKQRWEIRKLVELLPMALKAFADQGIPAMLPAGIPGPDGQPTQDETPNEQIAQFMAAKVPVEIAEPPELEQIRMMDPSAPRLGISIDNDDVHIAGCMEWLKTDEGMQAHPVLRRAVMIHMTDHVSAGVITKQYEQYVQMGATAPARAQAQQDAANQAGLEAGAKTGQAGPDSGKVSAEPSQANRQTGDELQQRLETRMAK